MDLLRSPSYAVPLVINLTGSVWFFLLIGKAGELRTMSGIMQYGLDGSLWWIGRSRRGEGGIRAGGLDGMKSRQNWVVLGRDDGVVANMCCVQS